jgi:hypothetical protein
MTAAGGRDCPNCGRERPASFCAHCGQSDRHYARSLGSVVVEFLREMFELDSRLLRTLKLLFFRPGSLTREFSRNRRVSFVSPVRLYIFASFLFFLLLSLLGNLGEALVLSVTDEDRAAAADADRTASVTQPSDSVAPPSDSLVQLSTEERLAAFRAALPPEQRRKADDILGRPEGSRGRQAILAVAQTDGVAEWNRIARFMLLSGIDIAHDPSVAPRRFLANMPIAMFCLLPFLGLILAVFNFRKKRFYVEHLVFAIHVQTFTFLIYAIALLFPDSGPGFWVRAGCLLIPYPYFVIALRRYYENGWILAVAKSVGVYALYSMALLPASILSVFVTG